MRMARCRQGMALLVLAAMLLVACGDDGGDEASSTTVAPTTPTTVSQIELDKQKAQRVVLTAADLPGFTQDPPDAGDQSADLEAAANACVNNDVLLVRLGEDSDPRGAKSEDFSRGETQSVTSSVTFGENEDQSRASLTAVGAAAFPGCFSNALATELRKDATFSNVSVSTARLPNLTGAGDQSVGWRSTARARVSGQNVTFYFDFTFVRVGRAVSVLSGLGFGTPFPEADRSRLATLLAGRMAAP